ncbi:class I SAM-dependent methyltransferase [Amycolatopsis pithecellobii]|uniref:Methyltransferase domain-containing protein n=1 Tax=Amycolatopsis pithecellobii TaxID=664692 RepID=A0A6N7Z327_9PSEU|nr:class I SAM-dependent methyltransferase [Amycolatopsis pithecellobii]MTD54561.1 methyltransferase domain-containing protein [Amycolatopsis pithecellobii]
MDEQRATEFTGRVLTDTAAAATTVLAAFGDRLGLFKDLAAQGPATSAQLARRTGLNERYVREWLSGMYAAGYLTYADADQRYPLPAEHAPALATEPGPAFFGGVHQELLGALQRYDDVLGSFHTGGGVHAEHLHPDVAAGTGRFTAQWHRNLLVQDWLPRVPGTLAKLRDGARIADIGCGAGLALITLAGAFPTASCAGYDVSPAAIETARTNAEEAGVGDRVRFEVRDAADGLPEHFDVITTFDVVHDAVDPLGMLRSIREGLRAGGRYLCLDINCSADPSDNVGPIATLLYGFSLLYCMTTSLAEDGEGLGTLGLPEPKLRELATRAGFTTVERVLMDNPFNALYELRR